ncbi:MAG: FRG domain-containing protein, partial [bacterium]|nr:FRG domain-containing protein [bacterium]
MSIKSERFDDANEAFNFLEKLALTERGYESFIFRGHCKEEYELTTTLRRHEERAYEGFDSGVDTMLDRFKAGLTKLNLLPFENPSKQDLLEFARHHGVPTP